MNPKGWSPDSFDFMTGADGNHYVQIEPKDNRGKNTGRNSIVALDPLGHPLWRLELGYDNFDLVAGGYSGELFGKRRGATMTSGKWTGSAQCDFVCLIPSSARTGAPQPIVSR